MITWIKNEKISKSGFDELSCFNLFKSNSFFFFFNWCNTPKDIGGLWHTEGTVHILSISSVLGEGKVTFYEVVFKHTF